MQMMLTVQKGKAHEVALRTAREIMMEKKTALSWPKRIEIRKMKSEDGIIAHNVKGDEK